MSANETILVGLDISTVSTGIAVVLQPHKTLYVDTLTLNKDEAKLDLKERKIVMVNKIFAAVKYVAGYATIRVYYEEVNVFLNANTIRAIAAVTYPLLFLLETKLHIRAEPIQVMRARKQLLGKPPYRKEAVFERLRAYAKNTDESDAIAILFGSPLMVKEKVEKYKRKEGLPGGDSIL